ncbi:MULTISPECIES: DUF1697 domain-containing protein [Paenibacillus]|uniref:DUF1697 domain-containing protein n=1 Tax=Paenibacillus TaxID=44249 RepID=UPI0004160AAA|nr:MULTISPECIES: DUF1697 domain-containing protein [Paenibacillus]
MMPASNDWIILLRGINVGGKARVRMADLKEALEAAGLIEVKSYIQSGNLIAGRGGTEDEVKALIEGAFKERFGFHSEAMLRTVEQWSSVLESLPFRLSEIEEAESKEQGESLYVCFLHDAPAEEAVGMLRGLESAEERFAVRGREIYLLFHGSIRDSKLAVKLGRLAPNSTVRNWKTVVKLKELADGRNTP